jgi:hypothetical protein
MDPMNTRWFRGVTLAGLMLAVSIWPTTARAQSWTAPRTWTTGELVTATIMNSAVRDNLTVLRAGGLAVTSQAIGDLLCASSTTQFARLADVAAGSYLRAGGVGACPVYSTLILPNAATANRIVYATATNTWGESAGLTFDGTTLTATAASNLAKLALDNTTATATNRGAWVAFQAEGASTGGLGSLGTILGTTAKDLAYFAETGLGQYWFVNASGTAAMALTASGLGLGGTNLTDSFGTVEIASGFGTNPSIAGEPYAFTVTIGTGSTSGGGITFGTAFANAPVCTVTTTHPTLLEPIYFTAVDTTSLSVAYPGDAGGALAGYQLFFLCRGY